MDIDRRALYNALRMNWLNDPTIEVEPWQVENYREMSLPLLFSRLRQNGFSLDKDSFTSLSENFDTPEELTSHLIDEEGVNAKEEDQVYLITFELWRRLQKDKPCLSIFCDELDHQIYLYDHGLAKSAEDIQDVLSNLQVILEENSDEGADPESVLNLINYGSANDIEAFLFDFILEQIENDNYSYAQDLLESFQYYVSDKKWFQLLHARLLFGIDPTAAKPILKYLIDQAEDDEDLEFNLELLSELIQEEDEEIFLKLLKSTLPLLEQEEDFQDMLLLTADFFNEKEKINEERLIESLLKKRSSIPLDNILDKNDPGVIELTKLIETSVYRPNQK